jgi:hypothetical protein
MYRVTLCIVLHKEIYCKIHADHDVKIIYDIIILRVFLRSIKS